MRLVLSMTIPMNVDLLLEGWDRTVIQHLRPSFRQGNKQLSRLQVTVNQKEIPCHSGPLCPYRPLIDQYFQMERCLKPDLEFGWTTDQVSTVSDLFVSSG